MKLMVLMAVAQPIPVVTLPERIPQSETLPAITFDCTLRDHADMPFSFKLQRTGGRAFTKDGKIAVTPLKISVTEDPDGKLSSYTFGGWGAFLIQGRSQRADAAFGSWIDLEWHPTTPAAMPTRVALMMREFRPPDFGMKPIYRAVGFCNSAFTPQSPLSAEETRKLLNR